MPEDKTKKPIASFTVDEAIDILVKKFNINPELARSASQSHEQDTENVGLMLSRLNSLGVTDSSRFFVVSRLLLEIFAELSPHDALKRLSALNIMLRTVEARAKLEIGMSHGHGKKH